MVWLPTLSDEIAPLLAIPSDDTAIGPARTFEPSLKVTVPPLGVPLPGNTAITVAVSVTPCPNTDGFGDSPAVVLVLAAFTVRLPVAGPLTSCAGEPE
jgi:hypothetical protein